MIEPKSSKTLDTDPLFTCGPIASERAMGIDVVAAALGIVTVTTINMCFQ
jgi:thiamine biosynthesis protein ThiC